MLNTTPPPPRGASSAGWMVLGGTSCALLLAVLVGVCASHVGAFEQVRTRPSNSVSASPLGPQERWVGVHDPSPPGQLELPRPSGKPSPPAPRFGLRQAPASPPDVLLIAHVHARLSRRTAEEQGQRADRPLVANCPARGPPRNA